MTIKEILNRKRKEKKLTQKNIAEILEISPKYFSDLECERKPMTQKIYLILDDIFEFSEEEKKILKKKKNPQRKEKKINEIEQEILNTYDFMREQHSDFALIAKITRNLIDLHKEMENYLGEIEISVLGASEFVHKRIEAPIKTTISRMQKNEKRLLNILGKEEAIIIK